MNAWIPAVTALVCCAAAPELEGQQAQRQERPGGGEPSPPYSRFHALGDGSRTNLPPGSVAGQKPPESQPKPPPPTPEGAGQPVKGQQPKVKTPDAQLPPYQSVTNAPAAPSSAPAALTGQPVPLQVDATGPSRAIPEQAAKPEPASSQRASKLRDDELSPEFAVHGTSVLLQPGVILRIEAEYGQPLSDRQRISVRFAHEEIKVDTAPGLAGRRAGWDEGRVLWEGEFGTQWRAAAWVGGAGSGVLGGLSGARTIAERGELQLAFYGHESAANGLLFEALDGRENRLEVAGNYNLGHHWETHGRLFGRELVVAHASFGWGWGVDWHLERAFAPRWPDFRAGYRLGYQWTDRQTSDLGLVQPLTAPGATGAQKLAALDRLALREMHRHGLYWRWRHELADGLCFDCGSGADYAFERSEVVYDGQAGFTFRPHKSLELWSGASYSSSPRNSDLDSDAWQIDLALRFWF